MPRDKRPRPQSMCVTCKTGNVLRPDAGRVTWWGRWLTAKMRTLSTPLHRYQLH